MELSKIEWDKKAEQEKVPDKLSFMFGVNAHANAVEGFLKKQIIENEKALDIEQDRNAQQRITGIIRGLEFTLTKLSTLTPTSNE